MSFVIGATSMRRRTAASFRDLVWRMHRHEAAQDAHLVRAQRRSAALRFAGLWTTWRGVRRPKSAPVEGTDDLFGFLTTEANAIIASIHPKAMPVILSTYTAKRLRREPARRPFCQSPDGKPLKLEQRRKGARPRCVTQITAQRRITRDLFGRRELARIPSAILCSFGALGRAGKT